MRKLDMDDMNKVSEIRNTFGQVLREEPVSAGPEEAARDALRTLHSEAAEYGLTHADVIRAVLGPMFRSRPTCNCPTCRYRRGAEAAVARNGAA